MKKLILTLPVLLIVLTLGTGPTAWADTVPPDYYDASDLTDEYFLTQEELHDLLAPIALYPDPLIAQILPAATFIDQINDAAGYVRRYGRSARIDDQPWDLSVKAVAHYPDVLFMMDQKYDWTIALGQAFVDQPQDVMDAIQYLRAEARARGNLYSTRQQRVIVVSDVIRIEPAVPEYIYIPVYDPQTVYLERPYASYGFITFGVGFSIGAWLNRDCDWRGRRVYYHGWRDGGWVSRSRPHIRDRRGIYINRRAAVINVNNRVLERDTVRFRQELRRDVERRRELSGRPAAPHRTIQPRPGRTRTPGVERQRAPVTVPPATIRQQSPGIIRQQSPGIIRQQAPAGSRQQSPGIIRQQAPAGSRQQAPGIIRQHVPAGSRQQAPAGTVQTPPAGIRQQAPAGTEPPSPAGVKQHTPAGRRQQAPGIIRQQAPETGPPPPARVRQHAPVRIRQQPVVQPPVVVPAPGPSITPAPAPSVAPAPAGTISPVPRSDVRPAQRSRGSAPGGPSIRPMPTPSGAVPRPAAPREGVREVPQRR